MAGRVPMRQVARVIVIAALATFGGSAWAECENIKFEGNGYAICSFDARAEGLRVFWRDSDGNTFGSFRKLRNDLEKKGETLVFAMNGGMYHPDQRPVGLYVENGEQLARLSTRRGPGNFHLQPNGVFYVGKDGANVMETRQFARAKPQVSFATQSGPMLVINGAIHPKFSEDSDSRKIRNGVGACAGHKIIFAISSSGVTFYDFATLFRDKLDCANALFLDGSISALYAPELKRADGWWPMGPIIGLEAKKK